MYLFIYLIWHFLVFYIVVLHIFIYFYFYFIFIFNIFSKSFILFASSYFFFFLFPALYAAAGTQILVAVEELSTALVLNWALACSYMCGH